MRDTIYLKDNEVLEDLICLNEEFNTLIKVEGDNVVIRNLLVAHPKKDFSRVISVKGKNCLIENCRFDEFDVNGPIIVLERREEDNRIDEPDNLVIKDCLFSNGRKTDRNNGLEGIRLGWSGSSLKGKGNCIIINNRFENYNREIEAISVKCCDNILVNNVFVNCESTLCLRHGDNNVVSYNKFDGKGNKESGGIRVVGENHIINNNVMLNIGGNGLRASVSLMNGVRNSPLNRYFQVKRCLIKDNIFFNCVNCLVIGIKKKEANVKPINTQIIGNVFDRCKNVFDGNSELKPNIEEVSKKYDTDIKEFKLVKYDELRGMLLEDDVLKEEEEVKEELEEEPKKLDKSEFTKLYQKLKLVAKLNTIKQIQKDIGKNLNEFRILVEEFREISKDI